MLVFAWIPYLPEYLEVIIQCHSVFQKNVKSIHTSLSQVKGKTDHNILQQMMVCVFNSQRPSAGPADSVLLWPQHKEFQAIQSSSRLMMIIQSCTTFYNSHGAGTVSLHLHFFFFCCNSKQLMLQYHYIWNIASSECWFGVYLDVYLAGIPLLKAVKTRIRT